MSDNNNPGQSYKISKHSKMSPHNQQNAFSLPGIHVFGTVIPQKAPLYANHVSMLDCTTLAKESKFLY